MSALSLIFSFHFLIILMTFGFRNIIYLHLALRDLSFFLCYDSRMSQGRVRRHKVGLSAVVTPSPYGLLFFTTTDTLAMTNTTAEDMTTLGDSIKEANAKLLAPRRIRFDQYLELLNNMLKDEKISTQDYFRISSFFMKKEQFAELFIDISANIRIK